MLREIVWLSGKVESFAGAEEVLERVGHLSVSDSSVWGRVDKWGTVIREQEEARREKANTLPKQERFRRKVSGGVQRIGVSMDGTKVRIREEGWKELKAGCIFELEVLPTWRKETAEWEELAHAVRNQYLAHLVAPKFSGSNYGQMPRHGVGSKQTTGKLSAMVLPGFGMWRRIISTMGSKY